MKVIFIIMSDLSHYLPNKTKTKTCLIINIFNKNVVKLSIKQNVPMIVVYLIFLPDHYLM